jgi:hypothetical protein
MRTMSNVIKKKSFDDIPNKLVKSPLFRINSRYDYKILQIGRYSTSYYFSQSNKVNQERLEALTIS